MDQWKPPGDSYCFRSDQIRSVAQSCPTPRDPMDCILPGSSTMGFSRQENWRGVPLPSLVLDQIRSDQSLSCVQLFVTPIIAARQASLSITNSWSSLRLTSIESVIPSSHLILCGPLLLLPPIPPSIRVCWAGRSTSWNQDCREKYQ